MRIGNVEIKNNIALAPMAVRGKNKYDKRFIIKVFL